MWTWTIVISMLNLVFSCSQRNIFSTFMLIQKLACADYPCYVWHHQFSFHFGKGIFFCIRWPPCSNPYSCISSWKYHQCTNLFLWPKSQWSDPKQVWYLIHQITSSLLVKLRKVETPHGLWRFTNFQIIVRPLHRWWFSSFHPQYICGQLLQLTRHSGCFVLFTGKLCKQ